MAGKINKYLTIINQMSKYNNLNNDKTNKPSSNMFVNHQGIVCYISKIDNPRIWYHINIKIPRYGEDYIKSKLGITDPEAQRRLQDEFYRAVSSKQDSANRFTGGA